LNQLKTIALLGVLSAILIVIGRAVSPGAMWIFGGLAVAMNLAAYFFSDRVVLAMSRARPLQPGQDPELERIVTELAGAAEIPVPRIYMIDDDAGAALSRDPLALASALAKLHRGNQTIPMHTVGDNPATASLFIVAPLSGAEVASWFSTHPPIAERIRRLQEMAAAGHARAA